MDDIWPEGKTRDELEENIFQMANSIPLEGWDSTGWLYSPELDQFIEAWYTLAKYYEINDDIEIKVETMSEYVAYVRLFRRILKNDAIEPRHHQRADDKLNDLEGILDELFKQAGTSLNNRLANK